jgi:hypothetical protein
MRYFQRRLFWTWLFSGGSANYGGRWWVLQPYAQTGQRAAIAPWKDATRFTAALTGLDSVPYIQRYFRERNIELSDFEPDHALVSDADGREGIRAAKLMRRGTEEYLVYHPNAFADGKAARADAGKTVRLQLDLNGATGTFRIEWYRPQDGAAGRGGAAGRRSSRSGIALAGYRRSSAADEVGDHDYADSWNSATSANLGASVGDRAPAYAGELPVVAAATGS